MPELSAEVADSVPDDVECRLIGDGDDHAQNALGTAAAGGGVIDARAGGTETQEAGAQQLGAGSRRRIRWGQVLAYGVLPALVIVLAMGTGYLTWWDSVASECRVARVQSMRAATEGAVALLSYKPDTVERDLGAARDRLTGEFKDSYTALTRNVIIPGSKQKQIFALANAPAAASVSASPHHAVVLVFINQTVTVGNNAPTSTATSVRVTLDKIVGRWLISAFDPVS